MPPAGDPGEIVGKGGVLPAAGNHRQQQSAGPAVAWTWPTGLPSAGLAPQQQNCPAIGCASFPDVGGVRGGGAQVSKEKVCFKKQHVQASYQKFRSRVLNLKKQPDQGKVNDMKYSCFKAVKCEAL